MRSLRALFWLGLTLVAAGVAWTLWPQPGVDSSYSPWVRRPAYGRRGPRVLIDEAHSNLHTAGGLYRPFATLLAKDGYRVSRNRQKLIPELLETQDILIIANPNGPGWFRRGSGIIDAEETAAVLRWVSEGGGLLLIADNPASVAAARPLTAALTVEIGGAANPGAKLNLFAGQVQTVEHQRGRVILSADAKAFEARIVDGEPQGLNTAGGDRQRFALDILHWLSRLI